MSTTPPPPLVSEPPQGLYVRSWAFLIVLVALVSYLPSLQNGLVWDDNHLLASDLILGTKPIWRAFFEDYWNLGRVWSERGGYYRPLTVLSLWLDQQIGGGVAFPFHLTAIALHAVTSVAIIPLALRFGASQHVARIASLLFAAHPHHAETVAWISGRPDLLMAATLLWSLAARQQRTSLVLGVCALLSKETAVVWPLLAAIRDRKLWNRERLRQVTIVALYLAIRAAVLAGGSVRLFALDFSTGLRAFFLLLGTWAWPFATPYAYTPITSWHAAPLVMWLGMACALGLIYLATARPISRPYLLAAAILHAPAALLMSATVVIGMRPMYAASAFVSLAIVTAITPQIQCWNTRTTRLACCFLAALVCGSAIMSRRWSDDLSYQVQAAASTSHPTIHENLSLAQEGRGRLREAWDTATHAQALGGVTGASFLRGRILETIGCSSNAVVEYERSLAKSPVFAPAHEALLHLYLSVGDRQHAMAQWEVAQRVGVVLPVPDPKALLPSNNSDTLPALCPEPQIQERLSDPRLLIRQANELMHKQRYELGASAVKAALLLDPDNVGAHLTCAQIHFLNGNPSEALTHGRFALKREPRLAPAMKIVGVTLLKSDPSSVEGRALVSRYLELTPQSPDAPFLRSLVAHQTPSAP